MCWWKWYQGGTLSIVSPRHEEWYCVTSFLFCFVGFYCERFWRSCSQDSACYVYKSGAVLEEMSPILFLSHGLLFSRSQCFFLFSHTAHTLAPKPSDTSCCFQQLLKVTLVNEQILTTNTSFYKRSANAAIVQLNAE